METFLPKRWKNGAHGAAVEVYVLQLHADGLAGMEAGVSVICVFP
jgi:hypothetical protein